MAFSSSSTVRTLGTRVVPLVGVTAISLYVARDLYTTKTTTVRNDNAPPPKLASTPVDKQALLTFGTAAPGTPVGWGSNKYLNLVPDASQKQIKNPAQLAQFGATALRDLVIQEKYGAAVDASGDLWMWGTGYDPSGAMGRSLRGKQLKKVVAGPGKVFSLSQDGRLYVVSADRAFQDANKKPRGYWKKLTTRDPLVDFVELEANDKFHWGEKWSGLAVGQHHLLAVTNRGRTFSLPLSPAANTHRQLGTKQTYDQPNSATDALSSSPQLPPESDPRFATRLTEIPALSGINVEQVAASDRSSFVRTPDGRVLGFGANDFGQIGLGPMTVVSTVPTPVEIALFKAFPSGTSVKCTDVAAGGQTTLFKVERGAVGASTKYVDLLACGNGTNGALGGALWTSAQYGPTKVKGVSGLVEYSEKAKAVIPLSIYSVSISPSPTTHCFATLDTVKESDTKGLMDGLHGKDVHVWGANNEYQIGNGKRSSVCVPQHLPSLVPHAIDTLVTESVATQPGLDTSPVPLTRLQLHNNKMDAYDLDGKLLKKGVRTEETMYAGYNCSVLYNKIVE